LNSEKSNIWFAQLRLCSQPGHRVW